MLFEFRLVVPFEVSDGGLLIMFEILIGDLVTWDVVT